NDRRGGEGGDKSADFFRILQEKVPHPYPFPPGGEREASALRPSSFSPSAEKRIFRAATGSLSVARCGEEHGQLRRECPLEGRSRLASGDIGGKVRIFFQHPRPVQPAQHHHHHEV